MFQILSKVDSLGVNLSYVGQQKIVHDFACLLEGHMQGISEDSWQEFQIDCLNLVHRYRQQNQLSQQPQQTPPMTWPAPQQQQPWQPPQQQTFWHQPQLVTWHALPQQQQQQPPASQPSPLTWIPPQSPQSSGQSSWYRSGKRGCNQYRQSLLSRLLHLHLQCRRCQPPSRHLWHHSASQPRPHALSTTSCRISTTHHQIKGYT